RVRAESGRLAEVTLDTAPGEVFEPTWRWRSAMLDEGWSVGGEQAPHMRAAIDEVVSLRLPVPRIERALRVEAAGHVPTDTHLRIQRRDGWQQQVSLRAGYGLLSFTAPPGDPHFELRHVASSNGTTPWLRMGRVGIRDPQEEQTPAGAAAAPAE